MASNSVNNLLVTFFFIAVASSSVAQGFTVVGIPLDIAEIDALGVLTCRIPGSNIPGNPITNATVSLGCNGGSFSIATTDVTGAVTAVLTAVEGIAFAASSCNATVSQGNLVSCTAYPQTFTVPVVLTFTRIITTAIGRVALFALSFGIPLL